MARRPPAPPPPVDPETARAMARYEFAVARARALGLPPPSRPPEVPRGPDEAPPFLPEPPSPTPVGSGPSDRELLDWLARTYTRLDGGQPDWVTVPSVPRRLLAPGGTSPMAGRLARAADGIRGVWMGTGGQWFGLNGEVVNVKEFGASPAATASVNTMALQAAFTIAAEVGGVGGDQTGSGATVVFPPGIYQHNGGLTLKPRGTGTQIRVNLLGLGGALGTELRHVGGAVASLTITNNVRYVMDNLFLSNTGAGTDGLALQSLAAGAGHGQALFRHVVVQGFTNGVHIGTAGDLAATDLMFDVLEVNSNVVGVLIEGINSLAIHFRNLIALSNTSRVLKWSGLTTDNSQIITIQKGDVGGTTPVYFEFASPLTVNLADIFSESSLANVQFALFGPLNVAGAPPTYAVIDRLKTKYATPLASRLGLPGTYSFRGCRLDGGVSVGDTANQNRYSVDVTGGVVSPIAYEPGSNSWVRVSRRLTGTNASNNQSVADDEEFLYPLTATKRTIWSFPWGNITPTTGVPANGIGAADKRVVLTYGASVATDATLGNLFDLTVPDGVAFTIANPTNLTDGQVITYTLRNTSGGVMGAVTWGTTFKLAAWTSPATANSRSVTYKYNGTNLVEIARTPADVPN